MLVYKAAQVVAAQPIVTKDWEMNGDDGKPRKGTSIYSDVTVLGAAGAVAVVRFKGKSEEDVKAKVGKLTVGKPAEIEIKGMETAARGVLVLNA